MEHLTTEQIEAALPDALASPPDQGQLEAIFVRPETDKREFRKTAYLSLAGVEGDRWAASKRPDTRAQVSLMNSRLLKLIARSDDRMGLAGDNLIVDLDLSQVNIPAGQKLAIGEALLQVTELPHAGCQKFAERYGEDARQSINAVERKSLRLRGVYARVLQAGKIQVGDIVRKVE